MAAVGRFWWDYYGLLKTSQFFLSTAQDLEEEDHQPRDHGAQAARPRCSSEEHPLGCEASGSSGRAKMVLTS